MLVVNDVYKSFGDVHVLKGVNLHIEEGNVYTLKGSSGSGKTTLFNIISGFLAPNKGFVEFKKRKITKFAPYQINQLGMGRTFQDLRLVMQMTVYGSVLIALKKKLFLYPTKEQIKRVDDTLGKVFLLENKNNLVSKLSYEQQKLLAIACCIVNDADLLLFDEPITNVDKDTALKITNLVKQLKQDGKTILQIEHNANYINATSDRILRLEKGIVI
ncbi:MAG: ATP-binding cassette domain-containing protein [Bacteroidales bacterium]|jgi:ABC-type branched-subunit amino acid transport system ATPase component|nr:ATP-binding cassette domain-containing protein [Bacteroidales bacterium]